MRPGLLLTPIADGSQIGADAHMTHAKIHKFLGFFQVVGFNPGLNTLFQRPFLPFQFQHFGHPGAAPVPVCRC